MLSHNASFTSGTIIMKLISNRHFGLLILLLAADGLLFGLTDATKVPAAVVMLGVILICATFGYLIYGSLSMLRLYGLPIKRRRQLVVYVTGVFAMLLALQSIGELRPRDAAVLLPLAVIAYLYSIYAKSGEHNRG